MGKKKPTSREQLAKDGVGLVHGHSSKGFFVYAREDREVRAEATFDEGLDVAFDRFLKKVESINGENEVDGDDQQG